MALVERRGVRASCCTATVRCARRSIRCSPPTTRCRSSPSIRSSSSCSGLGDAPQILIGFMLGVVAVIVNTLNGLDRVPRVLRQDRPHPAAWAVWRPRCSSRLPYAAPYILTGAKLAVAYSLIGVIGAEFIMSRGGMGYEISFAYTNFDNATMYPLILLMLAVSIAINALLSRWEKRPAGAAGPAMTDALQACPQRPDAWSPGFCCAWQLPVLVRSATIALRSPVRDRRASPRNLVVSDAFWPHLVETMRAFAACARHRGRARARARLLARPPPPVGRRARADAGRRLLDPEDHALPDRAARLRARHVGQDRVRRDPRHHSDRPVHHQRACATSSRSCSRPARVLQPGARPRSCAASCSRPRVPEIFTGIRVGFSLTLIGTLLGEMFAVAARPRLPPDERDRPAQCRI